MNDALKKICGLSIAPHDPETLKRWLEQEDALLFLEEKCQRGRDRRVCGSTTHVYS